MTTRIVNIIDEAISKNSLLGMAITFLSALGAKVQQVAIMEDARQTIVSLAADMGIIVGFLIGLLTLAIKSKDFYKKYFKDKDDEKDNEE